MTATCANGHSWKKYERWTEEVRADRHNFRRRFCWMCKFNRNKKRYDKTLDKSKDCCYGESTMTYQGGKNNIYRNRIEYSTPNLENKSKVRYTIELPNGAKFTMLETAVPRD